MTIYLHLHPSAMEYRGGVDNRNMWSWSVEEWNEYCTRYAEIHKQEIERERRINEARRRRTERNHAKWAERQEVNKAKNQAGWQKHPSSIERMQTALIMRNQGETFKKIGDELGVSVERCRQIYLKALRLAEQKRIWVRGLKSRPLDMGGPRDVWLTYYPSPDPRLDNMEPVQT